MHFGSFLFYLNETYYPRVMVIYSFFRFNYGPTRQKVKSNQFGTLFYKRISLHEDCISCFSFDYRNYVFENDLNKTFLVLRQ